MSKNFCTISTSSHLFKTFALADSLSAFEGFLHVLVIDNADTLDVPSNVQLYKLNELSGDLAEKLISKYQTNKDKLRWTLKPVFLNHLLETYDKVIYVDNDIYFYQDFKFLFQKLDNKDVLLTPHHYPRNPLENQNWFEANFKVGLYNAGFFAAIRMQKALLIGGQKFVCTDVRKIIFGVCLMIRNIWIFSGYSSEY